MKADFLTGVSVAVLSLTLFTAWLDPFRDEVSRGNSNYNSGKYSEALNSYKEAEKHAPDEKRKRMLEFNRGNAEFRLNNGDAAINRYMNSMNSGDPDVQKRALYNAGTVHMRMGRKKEAAESFIKALQIDPSYEKAKRNLEYLLKEPPEDKKENGGDKGDSNSKEGKSSDQGDINQKKSGNEKKESPQIKNMLESMKNKPVRREKGDRDGRRMLEKYW